jgi:hypothetical protein
MEKTRDISGGNAGRLDCSTVLGVLDVVKDMLERPVEKSIIPVKLQIV